jgi:hypothetical protein
VELKKQTGLLRLSLCIVARLLAVTITRSCIWVRPPARFILPLLLSARKKFSTIGMCVWILPGSFHEPLGGFYPRLTDQQEQLVENLNHSTGFIERPMLKVSEKERKRRSAFFLDFKSMDTILPFLFFSATHKITSPTHWIFEVLEVTKNQIAGTGQGRS